MANFSLLSFPENIIVLIGLHLLESEILSFCLTCQEVNYFIGQNQYFWTLKLIQDFGFVGNYNGCWKSLYRSYLNNVWVFGLNNFRQLGLGDQVNSFFPTKLLN